MIDILPDHSARFARAVGPDSDEIQEEMDEFAVEHGFPHVGPEVGGWLYMFARMVDAERVFEFGSGYGYSAYWFARALPEDGEIVLTEFDEDELEMGEEYMEQGGFDDLARYEYGDALDAIEEYEGPFDVVLIDHQKERYAEAFEAVRDKVAPGGIVVADNAMIGGPIEFEGLLRSWEDDTSLEGAHGMTRGIDEYLRTVDADAEFETAMLPVGEGIAVSHKEA